MTDQRRKIAWSLSKAAQRLPAAERQKFREFLFSLPGAEPPRRKVHSWKKKKAGTGRRKKRESSKIRRQLRLDFEDRG